jgi:hypothetical protein
MAIIGISGKIGSGKDTVGLIIQCLKSNILDIDDIKDRVVNNISIHYPSQTNYQVKKFADKLKDTTCLLIGCTREQLEDRKFKERPLGEEWSVIMEYGPHNHKVLRPYFKGFEEKTEGVYQYKKEILTPRRILQLLGTEAGRMIIHPNIWVNALFADYKLNNKIKDLFIKGNENLKAEYPNWIITDVRFENEAQTIKDKDGILIRLNRDLKYLYPEQYSLFLKKGLDTTFEDYMMTLDKRLSHPSEIGLDNYQDWNYVIDNNGSIEDLIEKIKQIDYE